MNHVKLTAVAILSGLLVGTLSAWIAERDPGLGYRQIVSMPRSKPPVLTEAINDRVVVENGNEFDFGAMDHEETREHTFRIRNQTSEPLTIRVLETTCKCTVGEQPKDAIPPGEVGQVTLRWTAKSFESDFRQSATIETSDPVQRLVHLSVHGRVQQLLSARPGQLVFSNVLFGQSREQTILVRSAEDDQLEVLKATWDDPDFARWFDVRFEPAPSDLLVDDFTYKSGVVCHVTLKGGAPLGRFERNLTLTTSATKRDPLKVLISGYVTSEVMIVGQGYRESMQELNLGVVSQADGIERQLRVIAKGAERGSFQIERVETEPADLLQAEIGEVRDLNNGAVRMQTVTIRVPPGSRTARFLGGDRGPAGKITLHTNHSVAKVLTIDVPFAVLDAETTR